MLTAEAKGFFEKSYEIIEDGKTIAVLKASSWKEKAEIELGGKTYRFKRDSAFKGPFLLMEVENVIAYAEKPSAFRERFEVFSSGKTFVLRKLSIWKGTFCLEENEHVVGTIKPTGWFKKRTLIDLPERFPLILRIFIFWLALVIWKRENAAVAGSG